MLAENMIIKTDMRLTIRTSCTTQEDWTSEKLALIRETSKLSGGSTYCFCVHASKLTLELHKKLQSLTTKTKNTLIDTVPQSRT